MIKVAGFTEIFVRYKHDNIDSLKDKMEKLL